MGVRILYVDDEPDIREVAGLALELDPEFEVLSCGSGSEALDMATQWRPDLILLDVMMPEMDGVTTFAVLKHIPEIGGTPVVFITARNQSGEMERLLDLGAKGVISKPFDPMTLAQEVRSLLL